MLKSELEIKAEELTDRNNELEKKAKAFDLLAEHVELINMLTKSYYKRVPMCMSEIEIIADALDINIE